MRVLKMAVAPSLIFVILLTAIPFFHTDLQQPDSPSSSAAPFEANRADVLSSYGKLPLCFVANRGQTDASVLYYAGIPGGRVYITANGLVFDLIEKNTTSPGQTAAEDKDTLAESHRLVMRLNFQGSNSTHEIIAGDSINGYYNYLIGNDPAKWRTEVPAYKEIVYRDIYANIDLRLYGTEGAFTYDFIVHPGGDVSDIRLALEGINNLNISGDDLVMSTALGDIRQSRLNIYQGNNISRETIEGRFKLVSDTEYCFAIAAYDRGRDLVIDPALLYSTYLGGIGEEESIGIAVDEAGCAYITGWTHSFDFPTTTGSFQPVHLGAWDDAFVTKLNPTGTALIYSTYLGGSVSDIGTRIKVDEAGCAYLTGSTESDDFPVTAGAFQQVFGGYGDAFITKLNPTGTALVYSSYLGGADEDAGDDIAVDSGGYVYVAGYTDSDNQTFPVTPGAFQTEFKGDLDGFIAKVKPDGSALVYCTYLGGTDYETVIGLFVDGAGCAYATGLTESIDFPTTAGAFQSVNGGNGDAFVTKLNPSGTALAYSTYLGGSETDIAYRVQVDQAGCAYVVGITGYGATTMSDPPATNDPGHLQNLPLWGRPDSDRQEKPLQIPFTNDFPVTAGAFQPVFGGGGADAFVTKLNTAGSALIYSTYLGGQDIDEGTDIWIDGQGYACVTGATASQDFPVTATAYQGTFAGVYDAFITKLNPAGAALIYSTYLGGANGDAAWGIAADQGSLAYIAGFTDSVNFPVTPGAFQTTFKGVEDAFVAKFSIADPPVVTTGPATGVNFTDATLNGVLTSAGTTPSAGVSFQYGGSPGTYNSETPAQASGAGPFAATINLLGNWQGMTVYYRARAVGADGLTTYGAEMSYTLPSPQTLSHGAGSSLTTPPFVPISNIVVLTASLSTKTVTPGTPVTVTADITNKSAVNGSKMVTLYVNGQVDSTQGVAVNNGASSKLTFNVSRSEPGDYSVYVDGVPAGSFKVEMVTGNDSILIFSVSLIILAFIFGMAMLWRRQRTG